jgi:hypothetical protein
MLLIYNFDIILISTLRTSRALCLTNSICWDITPCDPLEVNRRFRGTCGLHPGSKNKPSKKPAWNQVESRAFLDPEDGGGGDMFLRNVSWLLTEYLLSYTALSVSANITNFFVQRDSLSEAVHNIFASLMNSPLALFAQNITCPEFIPQPTVVYLWGWFYSR